MLNSWPSQKMLYLQNFLFIFSLRFGCRMIAYLEIIIYCYGLYYMVTKHGFTEMLESMIIISLTTSLILSILMSISTLQGHESSGIIFTYLMWGIFTTLFLGVYYIIAFSMGAMGSTGLFLGLFVGTTIVKCYFMLVVLSFLHTIVNSDSDDSI